MLLGNGHDDDPVPARGVVEFDCAECGRHIVSLGWQPPHGNVLCAACITLPGWFAAEWARCVLDPEWRAPEDWRCEVAGCGRRDVLLRTSPYDRPWRGRCLDHLALADWRQRRPA